jgi:hypothetical protein
MSQLRFEADDLGPPWRAAGRIGLDPLSIANLVGEQFQVDVRLPSKPAVAPGDGSGSLSRQMR